MKQVLFMAATVMTIFTAKAQTADYKPVLKITFDAFDSTHNNTDAQTQLANKLVLIARKYPGEWVTNYYASYAKVQLSYNNKIEAPNRYALLDEADLFRDEAVKLLGKNNSETYVLSAMIANGRLSVDGKSRWQKYGKIFDENLDNAKTENPDNPRIYLTRGISKMYTPKMFGGGKKAAISYFEKANTLFAKESTADITKPYWGKNTNDYFIEQAKGNDD